MRTDSEINKEFEKAEKLLEGNDLESIDREHLEMVQNVLGWVLKHYETKPLDAY